MRRLAPFPFWSSNPYLNLLALAARGAGWEVVEGLVTVDSLAAAARGLEPGDVVHIHWTAPVLDGAQDAADALRRADAFGSLLGEMRAHGLDVLWTVHNEVAHNARFHEAEIRVVEGLALHATRIVQLHELTADAVRGTVVLPEDKLVTLPHSSYLGVYPDLRDDAAAREEMGVPAGVPTVGFVGQVRPYKGLDVLARAMDLAAERVEDLTLVVAGRVRHEEFAQVDHLLPHKAHVVSRFEYVPDAELGAWLRASDVVALPYSRILNSGSLLAAVTFGRRCLIPDDTPLAAVYAEEPWVRAYAAAGDPAAALADTVVAWLSEDASADRAAADAYARAWTPYDMSRAYLRILDALPAANTQEARA